MLGNDLLCIVLNTLRVTNYGVFLYDKNKSLMKIRGYKTPIKMTALLEQGRKRKQPGRAVLCVNKNDLEITDQLTAINGFFLPFRFFFGGTDHDETDNFVLCRTVESFTQCGTVQPRTADPNIFKA